MKDLTSQKFGYLTAIKPTDKRQSNSVVWECVCDCGNHKFVRAQRLTSGIINCCGWDCKAKSRPFGRIKNEGNQGIKHDNNYRLYRIWRNMKYRCSCKNKSDPHYRTYSGKGIKVCEEWESFNAFESWALENGYDPIAKWSDCTLDRIDPSGNYEPSNCRWVDMKTQQNNRTNNKIRRA